MFDHLLSIPFFHFVVQFFSSFFNPSSPFWGGCESRRYAAWSARTKNRQWIVFLADEIDRTTLWLELVMKERF